jgi:hypothetical protein
MAGHVEQPLILEEHIVELLKSVVKELPDGCASLEVGHYPVSVGGGVRVKICPSLATAAGIEVRIKERTSVDLAFGRATVLEVPAKGRRYTDRPCMEEIRLLCMAVICGRFKEHIWMAGETVFRCRAKLEVQDKWHTFHFRFSFHPFRRHRQQSIIYPPWC